ncbi:diacylglycerol kinase [Agaricicola taiwanensis]|uniref:Diacylglycerol kinase n=1 Tax=Agaricicola taiwanensis TaxID=591372 RepID=A0A8J2VVG8_9RHOB|nr:diacylglycerol kinase family protein [Agaricicola taiwanensis]GGE40974.1 diacylglycerol kinase [Agaricicola taiwanensis]
MKTKVILNARAGTLLDKGGDDPAGMVERAFEAAGQPVDVILCETEGINTCLDEAVKSEAEAVIIGGGDGTVAMAVDRLAGKGTALGILPFGTLNLLAKDIGIPLEFEAAVEALAKARPKMIDLAEINDKPFHTLSGLGFFSEIARAREEVRGLKLPFGRYVAVAVSAYRALKRVKPMKLELDVDGSVRQVEAYALLVTNNAFEGPGWSRPRLDEGVLEVHVGHDTTLADRLKAGADLITDAWRDNPEIESFKARRVTVSRRNRTKLWTATDGEVSRETAPLRYSIRPRGLAVLAPD